MFYIISRKRLKIYFFLMLILLFVYLLSQTITSQTLKSETKEYWKQSRDIFWTVENKKKLVAITFDDGPDPKITPMILDILQKENVKATFFVVGNRVSQFPKTSKLIVDTGNEIANHGYSHISLRNKSPQKITDEIEKAENIILETTKFKPTLFRPPMGYYNKTIVETAKASGYKVILWTWTKQTNDWANPGVNKIIKRALNDVQSGDIILLHDFGGDRMQTVKALEPIIKGLKKQGFKPVPVREMLR